MTARSVKNIFPLGMPWATQDPFLFCVHHLDMYPEGNDQMGPAASLAGRNIGSDFSGKDGFSMYHGSKVPGFPAHPHVGFETVTIGRQGWVDHSDSLGAAGRFGNGDVQWMTAGKGVQHCEMFPLVNTDDENTLEIFQIWLNLPAKSKQVPPHFAMLWNDQIPKINLHDEQGKTTEIDVIAGDFRETKAPAPTPDSWAATPENEVAIWTLKMEAGATIQLPAASPEANRSLYFYAGDAVSVAGEKMAPGQGAELQADHEVTLENGSETGYLLLLQGRPINEPVAQHGPFVMNTMQEIQQVFADYQRTSFGGWPWPSNEHVHPKEKGRFAKYADGSVVEKA